MQNVKNKIAEAIFEKLNASFPEHGLTAAELSKMLEYPPDENMGDLSLPCFKLSKSLRRPPQVIAATLAEGFSSDVVDKAECLGGYLNFRLDRKYFGKYIVSHILEKGQDYGKNDSGKGKTVVLDYSSPNVAKPFHIGHLGTTVIGHSLKKMHEFAGYHCIGINHLGDWGTQFGKMIVAYKKWGDREKIEAGGIDELVALYVRFHAEAEADPSLNDQAREAFTRLEHFEPEETELWKWFIEISIAEYKKTYAQLDIDFDYYLGESFYTDKMMPVVEDMKEKNLLKIDDGASIVDLEAYGMPPCLILKRDGSTLYPTRDIAAAIYRKNTYNFDKCIYVTDAGQSLHFAQWFKVVELMGYDWYDQLVHIPYGKVSINGEKLATRTGNVILLKDLFKTAIEKVTAVMKEKNPALADASDIAEAVGVGAVIFYYLSSGRIRDINFVMEEALNFDGNTGPYAQYTYARCCGVGEKAEAAGVKASSFHDAAMTDEEFQLAKTLSRFPEVFENALREYEPSVITRYILDVCAAFNRFYHECPIVSCEDEAVRENRTLLTLCTKYTLANAFSLICMKSPEKI